ncbi:TonB-dependent receptor, partial [Helicobacter typhlonius]
MKINIIYIKGFFFPCAICFVSNLSLYATQDSSSTEQSSQHRSVKFSTSIITATPTTTTYKSGSKLNKTMLDSTPSGNGDITSILKIIPNVQFDNAQLKSSTPGEIDPANISISGGLFYQNNFQLDGFNMNNDLDPNGGATNGPNALRSGRSQGLAVDTSLLESIQVQDSNISAAYGGFTGGVVEANVRKPRADKGGLFGWHGGVSYQFTSSDLTQYFIDESQETNFITSSNENYQPNFTKHLIRANLEGYATQNLGIITSFSTTRSFIPLKGYSLDIGTEANATREQHRYIDNYYIKTHYNPSEKLTLEASLAYMPQDNTYYNNVAKHSFYSMKSGGIQSGLKALYDSNIGLWSNTLSYSFMQNSRESEKNYFMSWYYSQGDKDWAGTNSRSPRASEGGYGDMEQIQNTLNYKSNMNFESLDLWKSEHTLNIGFEANYTHAYRNRKNPYYSFGNPTELKNKPCGTDSMFDFATCSNTQTQGDGKTPNAPWQGQYFNQVTESKSGEIALDNLAYGIYAEDSILLDLEQIGKIQTRLGLRLDGDTYMQKHTLAPRFSLNYTAPWEEYKSELIFGANRYYGRNLLSYRLYELVANNTQSYSRNDSHSSWTPTTTTDGKSSYDFQRLNVPYSDEL